MASRDWSRTRDGETLQGLARSVKDDHRVTRIGKQSAPSLPPPSRLSCGRTDLADFCALTSQPPITFGWMIQRSIEPLPVPILRSAELPIRCGSAQRKKSEPGGPSDVKQFTGNSKFPLSA